MTLHAFSTPEVAGHVGPVRFLDPARDAVLKDMASHACLSEDLWGPRLCMCHRARGEWELDLYDRPLWARMAALLPASQAPRDSQWGRCHRRATLRAEVRGPASPDLR